MSLSLIVAKANDNVIGINNQLPWHLSADLKYFKSVTMGKPIIMGRKTFDSIGRALPGRRNIVITRDKEWRADDIEVFHSIDDALAAVSLEKEAMVIGGEQIYRETLGFAQKLYVTEVALDVAGHAFFPAIDDSWEEVTREKHEAVGDQPSFAFVVYQKKT